MVNKMKTITCFHLEANMTERERLQMVLKGQTPDRVPWFADLGHWFRAESGAQWDLVSISNCTKEIAIYPGSKAGCYIK